MVFFLIEENPIGTNQEKWYTIGSQVFIPFMIAGCGMVAAGLVLERVKVDAKEKEKNERGRY